MDDKIGPIYLFLLGHLLVQPVQYLLAGQPIPILYPLYAHLVGGSYHDHPIHKLISAAFVGQCGFFEGVRGVRMGPGPGFGVSPYSRMDQVVELLQQLVIGKGTFGEVGAVELTVIRIRQRSKQVDYSPAKRRIFHHEGFSPVISVVDGNAQCGKYLAYGRFSAADPSGNPNFEHSGLLGLNTQIQWLQFTIFAGYSRKGDPVMAKFRMNHARQGKGSGANIIRVGVLAALLAGSFLAIVFLNRNQGPAVSNDLVTPADTVDDRTFFLPTGHTGQVIHHRYHSLAFAKNRRQTEWVAYVLTRDRVLATEAIPVASDTAKIGFLIPPADLAFSERGKAEAQMPHNHIPQSADLSRGLWQELGQQVRSWARQWKKLYVVAGPVWSTDAEDLGVDPSTVSPRAFFKVILDLAEPDQKALAFWLPNQAESLALPAYMVPIDTVEARTGLNFFGELMPLELERQLEASLQPDRWPLDSDRAGYRN